VIVPYLVNACATDSFSFLSTNLIVKEEIASLTKSLGRTDFIKLESALLINALSISSRIPKKIEKPVVIKTALVAIIFSTKLSL
jgi:hypothetical protein